jgi:NAD(P)-dependent dehydrogenase (short-subunit alcohol dehydrogenase family)
MSSVLTTGAARGVGRGLALAFAAAGWDVAITARDSAGAHRVRDELPVGGGRAIAVAADVTVPGAIEAAIEFSLETFGGLDAVVHNAVSGRSAEQCPLETASLELWEEHASVSLRALWRVARAAGGPLGASNGALLVLTSPAGINGSAGAALYGTVKAGQRAFVRSLAREWGRCGIRVNGLAPLARTEALDHVFLADPTKEAALSRIVPLGRFGDPVADIGPPAVFLCSEGARYITGQNLVVSGGRLTST